MRLSKYMAKHGLDDTAMAQLADCDRTSINRISRGNQMPSWPLMFRIMDITKGKVLPNDYLPERVK